ncbi:MAG TPA: hypothetical protein VHQ23_06915 [Ilumatobacteraceae bacterium]|nr:hypothetical protein [Ilumatobacteraceae bacterium]
MADPHGPVITPPGQYTHCVDRADYRDVPGGLEAGFPSILEFTLCEYLLGGKLVCLAGGRDRCAIGTVVGVEEVGYQKSGFDAIDNDFSFNLLLVPYAVDDFERYLVDISDPTKFEAHKIRDDVAAHSPLGWLMLDNATATSPLPTPREPSSPPAGTSPVDGYGVLYSMQNSTLVFDHENQNNLHKLWEHSHDGSAVSIPILHCECEGSRIFFVCQAMKPFIDLMQGKIPGLPLPSPGEACHALLDWVPFGIGKAVCSIIEDIVGGLIGLAIWPAALATFATAWEAAQAFDDLFVTGPIADQIHVGDTVVVTGRWVWDAGHAGHCEFHPVKTIQKITLPSDMRGPYVPADPLPAGKDGRITDYHRRWQREIDKAPPPPDPRGDGHLTGAQLETLTDPQHEVYVSQQRPENHWVLHPAIDACARHDDPHDPPPDIR